MGLFDKFKKSTVPQRVNGAALLFCPESDYKNVLDQIEQMFKLSTLATGTISPCVSVKAWL